MDEKLTPTSGAGSVEGALPVRPEQSQPGAEAPASESLPQLGSPSADPAASGAVPPAKLTSDQVAAAIAATPGPNGPVSAVSMPASADDVDVIEPEWVDKAEHDIAAHQGDPYGEEEAIEDLQQDYLDKRYGYKVSNPNSDSSKPEGT